MRARPLLEPARLHQAPSVLCTLPGGPLGPTQWRGPSERVGLIGLVEFELGHQRGVARRVGASCHAGEYWSSDALAVAPRCGPGSVGGRVHPPLPPPTCARRQTLIRTRHENHGARSAGRSTARRWSAALASVVASL